MTLIGLALGFLTWCFIRAAKDVANVDIYLNRRDIKQFKMLHFAALALFNFGLFSLAVLLSMIVEELSRLF